MSKYKIDKYSLFNAQNDTQKSQIWEQCSHVVKFVNPLSDYDVLLACNSK